MASGPWNGGEGGLQTPFASLALYRTRHPKTASTATSISSDLQPDDTHIAAGMTDGTLAVRRRDPKTTEEAAALAKEKALQSGSYEFFTDMEAVFGTGYVKQKGANAAPVIGPSDEFKVESRRTVRLKEFDRYLKGFKYSSALDAGLKPVSSSILGWWTYGSGGARPEAARAGGGAREVAQEVVARVIGIHMLGADIQTIRPSISFALIQELIFRDALRIALSGRDETTLEPILAFCIKHIIDPRFGELAGSVVGIIIGTSLVLSQTT